MSRIVTVEIPIGPQHPAVHEPILLKLYADGEEVIDAEIVTGYNHRGIEKLCEVNTFYKDIFIVSRTCGICNTIHGNTFVRALEYILGVDPSPRAKYLRVLALELERIHSHMLIGAVLAEIAGFDTLFMLIMRDRELVMKAKEILTGCRVHADFHMPGGVRRDLDEVSRSRILDILRKLEPRIKHYRKIFENDPLLTKRMLGIGKLGRDVVVSHGLLGPVARASGVKIDARIEERYDAYGEVPIQIVTRDGGDVYDRMLVRWDEALISLEVCRYVLEHLPQGQAVVDERRLPRRFPEGEALSRGEAPRGELLYYVVSKGGDKPYRVKIRTPSLNNIVNSAFSYIGYSIADAPVIFASYDPCISCMERAIVVYSDGSRKLVSLRDLAQRRVRL